MTARKLSPLMRVRLQAIRNAGGHGRRMPFDRTNDALLGRGLIYWRADPGDPLSYHKIWRATDAGRVLPL